MAVEPTGLRAFWAIGDLGLSCLVSCLVLSSFCIVHLSFCLVLVPGTNGSRTVGTKGPFEALGRMAYMGFSTFGVGLLCTFTMPYYSVLFHK